MEPEGFQVEENTEGECFALSIPWLVCAITRSALAIPRLKVSPYISLEHCFLGWVLPK
jgi:hypothetical protein